MPFVLCTCDKYQSNPLLKQLFYLFVLLSPCKLTGSYYNCQFDVKINAIRQSYQVLLNFSKHKSRFYDAHLVPDEQVNCLMIFSCHIEVTAQPLLRLLLCIFISTLKGLLRRNLPIRLSASSSCLLKHIH